MANDIIIALTNALEGQEDAFNDWYSNRHVADLLKIPGLISAKRYRLSPSQRTPPPFAFAYLAIYEIAEGRTEEVVAEIQKRAGTDLLYRSPAVAPETLGLVFEPIR